MIAAIYARISRKKEDDRFEEAASIERQIDGGRAFITSRGWTVADQHIYKDDGVSGALFAQRAEFQRLMRDATAGAFQALVFFDLDRFGRDAAKTMSALNTLTDLGVEVWDYSTGRAVDMESFEGETLTFLKARFAQQYREQVRKHTREALRKKAADGYVAGGKVYGYDNEGSKGRKVRRVNEVEAAIVREVYDRFAAGQGAKSIARSLNLRGAPSPRAQQGRPCGWSTGTVYGVLDRPLYRGEVVYGRTAKVYGRELGRGATREKAQRPKPAETWLRHRDESLAIVSPQVAARVDELRAEKRDAYKAAEKTGRAPQKAYGRFLLSGGLLKCEHCGANFEARKHPWRGQPGGVYMCSTRRRKPGTCDNTVALPIAETDEEMLGWVEGLLLDQRLIDDLMAMLNEGDDRVAERARLEADRDRLRAEIDRLMASIAAGIPAEEVAPLVLQRRTEVGRLEQKLRIDRPETIDGDRLRAALHQQVEAWRADLRREPRIGNELLRRMVEPLAIRDWSAAELEHLDREEERLEMRLVRWETRSKAADALLDSVVQLLASPAGFEPASPP
jgi:site-specific DNA recombinase